MTQVVMSVLILYSFYWPPLGGTNCAEWQVLEGGGGTCISRMASGERWQDWAGRAIACPAEWPFGTEIVLDGEVWTCLDRGGKVRFVDDAPYIDFLSPTAAYGYGTELEVEVRFPRDQHTQVEDEEVGLTTIIGPRTLLESEILSLDYLATREVEQPKIQDQVSPVFKPSREASVSETSIDTIQGYAYPNTQEYRDVPLNSRDWKAQLLLEEVLKGPEEPIYDWSLKDPVYTYHRQAIQYQLFKYLFK